MFQTRSLVLTLALSLGGLVGAHWVPLAEAQGLSDRRPPDDNSIEAGGYTLDDAVDLAQKRYGARVVKAETVDERGRRVHYIRLLSAEGRVWTVRVDAETGRMQ